MKEDKSKAPKNPVQGQVSLADDFDSSLLDYNLSLTPEERLKNHQHALDLMSELLKARKEIYGEPEPSPDPTA